MKRKQFTFYESFYKAMADMGMHKRGLAITLICDYALYGIEPSPQCGKMQMFMDLVYPNLAASRKKALAGQLGAGVTNRKGRRKVENETEIETEIKNEIERECVSRAGFERFWNLYPMKIAKEEAWAVWRRLEPKADAVCDGVALWMKSRQWLKDGNAYIPRAAKFLEQEYYLQTPECAAPKGAVGQLGAAEIEAIQKIMEG